ncbi:MAG: hypothetical protein K0R29_2049 [Pseudobdellovibrio sp.]|nr:hypothetical protein [Pseudobdellovibrio sp.]
MKTLFFALIFAFSAAQAQLYSHQIFSQQIIKIENPSEFEFIHCVNNEVADDETVIHYVLDVRNQNQAMLFWEAAPKRAKAVELTDLKLLDDKLLMNTLSDVDLSYVSVKNQLVLALNISDTDGYVLDGELRVTKDKYRIRCMDTSQEK